MVKQFASQQPLAANPYAVPRTIEPAITNCVLCHRPIKTKDWSAHKNSKAHRKREDEERRAENGFEGGAVNIPFGTDIPVATEASLNSWGSPEAANFSAGGANASGGNPCYECGEQGHMKRDW
ncbi:hypothetical protein P280DRAFT_84186 [Massarina eburnea CBS 473.64]|uniref:CCHC-type domain-containing protein n=1 Tax=Massarina eburnea CBS 473.64 TaxID=1395130 RepID=A0A6A6RUN4_9PLEO|nr:hypothetical protein P280DRAFT_84186 [Massarina eburnea CBS 473.64]